MSAAAGAVRGTDIVTIRVDDRELRVAAGVSLAAAMLAMDVLAFRRSVTGERRGPLCGMGSCQECRVTVDGVSHRRACLVTAVDGLQVSTLPPAGG